MAVNATEVLYLTSGLFKAVPSKAILTDLVKFDGTIDGLAATLGTSPFAVNAFPFSNAEKAKVLAENLLGSTVADKAAAITALEGILNANGGNVGIAAAAGIRAILTDAAFADAKAQLENRVKVAAAYVDSNKGNEISTSILDAVTNDAATVTTAINSLTGNTGGNEAGVSRVLTTGQDVFTGTAGDDNFRAVAGVQQGSQDQTTLNSADNIDGATGNDTLIVNMTGTNYAGGARIKNIETLQIGTNLNTAVTFDYNINQGQNEITEVTKVVYDQINQGENLRVVNLLKTGDALPTLAWTNEANSMAGTIQADFRQSAIEGTSTALTVELNNVLADNIEGNGNGRLDIGAGVETLTIVSGGTSGRNTLDNSNRTDGRAADIVSAGSSTTLTEGGNDDGSLKKVIVTGSQAFGKVATVVTDETSAAYGLTNRAQSLVANNGDLGRDATQTTSTSNLVSVAATVTEIDATAADGGVAMRFSNKQDGTAQNVTFKGGKGADYIEFQLGNVNAEGGEGADTFAFVTTDITNFGFGSADSIKGGAGSDTILLGMNGIGNVVANTTEFNDKTGIEVLDLRGAVNTVTLADAFVAGADTGTFTVRTDRIVQTSDTDTANKAPSTGNDNRASEDNSVNTIVLTELADNRAVEFIGGSGADRVVVDNASANQFTKLDGGANRVAGVNDSLTVVNTARLDANDVANIKGFELLNVVETSLGNNSFDIEISEAFLLANSSSATALTIASVTGTYGQRLGAGDVVNLEISNLLSNNVAKASINGRVLNIQDLIAAGVTVNFQQNGVTVSTNAAPAALAANVNTTTAPAATLLDDVAGAAAGGAAGGAVNNITLTAGVLNNGTAAADNISGTQANLLAAGTAVDGLAGADTLTLTDAATAALTPAILSAKVFNVETLALANVANTVTLNTGAVAGSIQNINGGSDVDTITLDDTALVNAVGGTAVTNTINLGAGGDTLNLSGAGSTIFGAGSVINGGDGVDTINVTAAANLTGVSLQDIEVVNFSGAAINITLNRADLANYTNSANRTIQNSLDDAIIFADTGASQAVATFDTYTLANGGVNTFTNNLATAVTVNGGSALDYITGGAAGDTIGDAAGGGVVARGMGGDDAITLGAGADVVIFEATGAANGTDTITGFAAGAGNDVLNVANFLGAAGAVDANGGAGVAITAYAAADNADVNIANRVVLFNTAGAPLTAAGLVAEIEGAGNAFALNGKAVVVTGNTTAGANVFNIMFVDSSLDGNAANVTAADITIVGVSAGNFDLDTLVTTNFAFV